MGGILVADRGTHIWEPGTGGAWKALLPRGWGNPPSGAWLDGIASGTVWTLGHCLAVMRSGGQPQMGSLAGAAHLLKHNAGVLRRAQ